MPFHANLMSRFESVTSELEARIKASPLSPGGALKIGAGVVGAAVIGNKIQSIVSTPRKARKKTTTRRKSSGTHKRSKRAIKRGRGLGKKEIHHGHKGKKLVRIPGSKPFYAYPKGHPMSKHNKNKKKRR